ncbi:Sister chromatid cohesion protein 2 [Borealophlyctis nickersoniae]|nr:Sister chromatid cohesion protein 2 [Borealophlyctis nickersoniae]
MASSAAPKDLLSAVRTQTLAGFTSAFDVASALPSFSVYQPPFSLLRDEANHDLEGSLGPLLSQPAVPGSQAHSDAQALFQPLQGLLRNVDVDYLRFRNDLVPRALHQPRRASADVSPVTHGPLSQVALDFVSSLGSLPVSTYSDLHATGPTGALSVDPVAHLKEYERTTLIPLAEQANFAAQMRAAQNGFAQEAYPGSVNAWHGQSGMPPVEAQNYVDPRIFSPSHSGHQVDPAQMVPRSVPTTPSSRPVPVGKTPFTNGLPFTTEPDDIVSYSPQKPRTPAQRPCTPPGRSLPPEFSVKRRRSGGAVEVIVERKHPNTPTKSKVLAAGQKFATSADEVDQEYEVPVKDEEWVEGGNKKRRLSAGTPAKRERRQSSVVSDWKASSKKAVTLIESIFRADDAAADNCDVIDTEQHQQQTHKTHFDESNLLGSETLKNLTKYIRRLANSHHVSSLVEEMEESSVSRLLKLFELRIKDAEYVDAKIVASGNHSSPKKPKKKQKVQHVVEEEGDGERDLSEPEAEIKELDPIDFEATFSDLLGRAECGLEACYGALLIICGISAETKEEEAAVSKKLYGEDLIVSCVNLVKAHLTDIVYAVLELTAKEGDHITPEVKMKRGIKTRLALLVGRICDVLGKLYEMLTSEILSDDLIISMYYVALSPFFVEVSSMANNLGVDKIQIEGIKISRAIFARYPRHRNAILEEILTSLIKISTNKRSLKQYRMPDGKSIQMVTALILQLIQSCCSNPAFLDAARDTKEGLAALLSDDSAVPEKEDDSDAEPLGKKRKKKQKQKEGGESPSTNGVLQRKEAEIQLLEKFAAACKAGTDAAWECARYALKFLLTRCSPSNDTAIVKTEKPGRGRRAQVGSTEAEYKAVLENLLKDIIAVLDAPEWPGASLMAFIFSRLMIQALEEQKKQGDTQIRTMAIDWLGELAGRIRTRAPAGPQLAAELLRVEKAMPSPNLGPDTPVDAIRTLWGVEKMVIDWFDEGIAEDASNKNAKLFNLSTWGISVGSMCFADLPDASRETAKHLMLEYCEAVEGQKGSLALDSDVVAIRTKALKALQEIITADPTVLTAGNVKKIIFARLMDHSTSVRDAAIELVGKYLAGSADMAREYYPVISDRVLDVGTNVRKRIVKLLKEIYLNLATLDGDGNRDMMIDIAVRLMGRLSDEETTVKDLALKALHEMWFSPFRDMPPPLLQSIPAQQAECLPDVTGLWPALSTSARQDLRRRALLMVDAAARNRIGSDLVGDLLLKVRAGGSKVAREGVATVCAFLVECLVDQVLSFDEGSGNKESFRNVFNLLHQFSKAFPALLTGHIKTLRPYINKSNSLQSRATDERIAQLVILTLQNVVRIARDPNMEDLEAIQKDLTQLLNQASQPMIAVVVPCLCTIVQTGTKQFVKLTGVLRRCFEFVKAFQAEIVKEPGKAQNAPELVARKKTTWRCLLIVAQMVRHFDFDRLRGDVNGAAENDINAISQGSILDTVYESFMFFSGSKVNDKMTSSITLTALGHLFISHPQLMLRNDARALMDTILDGDTVSLKIELLRVFSEFLKSEQNRMIEQAEKKEAAAASAGGQDIDVKVLIGNADEMGDAGVSSSLMQLYLTRILDCMLDTKQELMLIAFDAVTLILEQGLVHPILCMPAVVAMESNNDPVIRERAFKLHQHLHSKHTSFIHTKNIDCVKRMFEYRKGLAVAEKQKAGGAVDPAFVLVRGFMMVPERGSQRPEAYLSRMYSIVQSGKARRDEFLMNLVKLFDVDLKAPDDRLINIPLCRFVAENVALLDFKTQEEVLNGIYYANRILSVTGETIMRQIESWKDDNAKHAAADLPLPLIAKGSVCIGMLLLLKSHLQALYHIPASYVSEVQRRCHDFQPHKGAKSNEKPTSRVPNISPILSWERLPFADVPIKSEEDMRKQCHEELMSAEYVSGFDEADFEALNTRDAMDGDFVDAGVPVDPGPVSQNPPSNAISAPDSNIIPPASNSGVANSPSRKPRRQSGVSRRQSGTPGGRPKSEAKGKRSRRISGASQARGTKRKRVSSDSEEEEDGEQSEPDWK